MAEICQRTGLSLNTVTEAIEYLRAANVLRFNEKRYFAVASILDFLGLKNKTELIDLCQQVSRDIQKNSRQILKRDSNLVFYSAHSIPRSRLPHLKEKLKASVNEILAQEQNDDGDAVVQVFLGSWSAGL